MVNYWASRWIVWTKNNLSSCHHHFDPDSSVMFSFKSCWLPVLVKLIVFSKCNKFCSVLVVVNGFPTNNRSRYDRIQIFFIFTDFLGSLTSWSLSQPECNITLRKSSKRVQCLNEVMFHCHLRFYVTQWSVAACVKPPPPLRKYWRKGRGAGCTVLWQPS